MRVNSFLMPILLIGALFGTVFSAQALGQWTTSGRDGIDVTNMTAAELKGWMTLQQVSDGLKISQKDLYELAGLPVDTPPTKALKDLEATISVTTLRDRLTAKLAGAPAPSTTKAATPVATSVATPVAGATATHATSTPLPAGQVLPADQIKGKMTLREVSDQCVVPLDKLLAGLKLAATTDPNTAIKDLVAQGALVEVTDLQKIVAGLQGK
jgi:hypothetical protein